jgi:uncharacterized protein with GYD domain
VAQVVAFVLVVTEVGKEYEVRDKIVEVARREGVDVEAYVVFGEYDVAVKLRAESLKNIDRAVTAIRTLGGVLRTVTLIASG